MQGGHQHPSRVLLLHRRGWLVAGLALLSVSLWYLGQGVYIKGKAHMAQMLLDNAWSETLISGEIVKPWPWFDSWPVAEVHVPRLNKQTIVLKSASGQAMAFGPGHMTATPLPGERGLSVIAAHRDTHFRFLKDVVIGDEVFVTTADGQTHMYRITGTDVRHAERSGLDPYTDGQHIALVTCYPFDALTQGPLRYVVFGTKIDNAHPLRKTPRKGKALSLKPRA